jgi:hypothetical protein
MDTDQLAIVTQRTIEGAPSRTIANEIGTHHTTVLRAQARPDIRAKVEQGINQLISRGLKPAISTITRFAALGNVKDITSDKDLAKLSLDASKTILSHVSGSGPQTVINQLIYSNSTRTELSQESLSLLQRVMDAKSTTTNSDSIPIPTPRTQEVIDV